MHIRNPALEKIGAIASPIMTWIRRWHKPGEFEMTTPFRDDIDYDTIISKCEENGVREAGVVRGYVIDTAENDALTISGPLLAGYAGQRLVWGTQTINGTPETVMKELVLRNMGEDADADRQFSGLTVEEDQSLSGSSIDYQNTDVMLDKELEQLSQDSGLGYDIVIGDGMVFRVLEGLDRTDGQSVNPRAVFTIERKNLISAEFEKDGNKQKNLIKIGNDLYTEVYGDATGYQRYESYVKASSVEKNEDGNENDEATQRALMQQQAAQKVVPMVLSFTCRIDPDGNLKYKEHYDLGDIVTCGVKRWGVTLDARITEVKEIYTVSGFGLEVTFGTGQLSIGENIRRIANG